VYLQALVMQSAVGPFLGLKEDTMNKKGFKFNGDKLQHWSSLLEEWLLLIDRYCRRMKKLDLPFFHSEKANTGILAGAAWRAGWITLQEFPATKLNKIGLGDLWFLPENKNRGEHIEAKLCWTLDHIKDDLKNATDDVNKIDKDESYIRIGLLFICPTYHKKILTVSNK
jgi:hypothetical protein